LSAFGEHSFASHFVMLALNWVFVIIALLRRAKVLLERPIAGYVLEAKRYLLVLFE